MWHGQLKYLHLMKNWLIYSSKYIPFSLITPKTDVNVIIEVSFSVTPEDSSFVATNHPSRGILRSVQMTFIGKFIEILLDSEKGWNTICGISKFPKQKIKQTKPTGRPNQRAEGSWEVGNPIMQPRRGFNGSILAATLLQSKMIRFCTLPNPLKNGGF